MSLELGGALVRARSVDRLSVSLARVLTEEHTGYLRIVADGPLDGATGVVTVVDGVPVAAVTDGERACGVAALDALAVPGVVRVETYRCETAALASLHDCADYRVPPGAPAERLCDDSALAARSRERAPASRVGADDSTLLSFLGDDRRLAAIRSEARAEARADADSWGLNDALADE